jgi:hypothetical protein
VTLPTEVEPGAVDPVPAGDRCPSCHASVARTWLACGACGARLSAVSELAPGTALFDGRLVVGRVLGRGGFGITYETTDVRLHRKVAVKELFPDAAVRHGSTVLTPPSARDGFELARGRFLQEARVLARFNHPGIVRVYEVFEENGTAYLVLELLEGRTLAELLRERGRPFTEAVALDIAQRVGGALAAIHASDLLHRDVSPSNLVVTATGRIVLIDFGLARAFDADHTSAMTRIVTPGYAPPEQYLRSARFGPPTDVYGLAATLYRLLTALSLPSAIDRQNGVALAGVRSVNPDVSKLVSDAILDGLELNPDHRPPSIPAFLARLGLDPRALDPSAVPAELADAARTRAATSGPAAPVARSVEEHRDRDRRSDQEPLAAAPAAAALVPPPLAAPPTAATVADGAANGSPVGSLPSAATVVEGVPDRRSSASSPTAAESPERPADGLPIDVRPTAATVIEREASGLDAASGSAQRLAREAPPFGPRPTAATGVMAAADQVGPAAAAVRTDAGSPPTAATAVATGRAVVEPATPVRRSYFVPAPTSPVAPAVAPQAAAVAPIVPPPMHAPDPAAYLPAPVVGPPRRGRWLVTVPVTAAVVALVSAAPVLFAAVVVLVALPALATTGDLALHRHRRTWGGATTWFQRRSERVAAGPRFLRNVAVSLLRAVPALVVLVVLVACWYPLHDSVRTVGAADWFLRLSGAIAGLLLVVPALRGSAKFATGTAVDAAHLRVAPEGLRLARAGWVLWLACALLVAIGLGFSPDVWPLHG